MPHAIPTSTHVLHKLRTTRRWCAYDGPMMLLRLPYDACTGAADGQGATPVRVVRLRRGRRVPRSNAPGSSERGALTGIACCSDRWQTSSLASRNWTQQKSLVGPSNMLWTLNTSAGAWTHCMLLLRGLEAFQHATTEATKPDIGLRVFIPRRRRAATQFVKCNAV